MRGPVGAQRSSHEKGTKECFLDIKEYRYGYETPFIPVILLSNVKDKSVLEIGIGNGIDAVQFVKNGAKYTGLDITTNHIELTKRNFDINGLSYENIVEGDLLTLNFSQKFDVVYSFGVLHHIFHESQYIAIIHDILKSNGEFGFGFYSKYSFF